jgi:serine/threonine protein kinase/tetratricopeptide (TPR) repeat protein
MDRSPKRLPEAQLPGNSLVRGEDIANGPAALLTPPPRASSSGDDAPTFIGHGSDPPPASDSNAPTLINSANSPSPGSTYFGSRRLADGTLLGRRYEIIGILGEGGMGAVYKANDLELKRVVALKVIRPDLAADPDIIERFKQELILARQVTHRNVIRIYDIGEAEGFKFITMEFVEGKDLRSVLRERGKLPPSEAVDIIHQVCLALDAAHKEDVIHRDLKPQNIMCDKAGRILVMDFGLARSIQGGGGMTQTGALVGTLEYMSPEQALAKDLDQRSDLFTLGLILYEMLTGVAPYKAESAVASLIKRNSERAIPVSDYDGTIPRTLSNIVSKCLERDPSLRYQNAAELLRDLDAWQGNHAAATLGFQPAVEPWARAVPWPLVTAIATVLALSIAAYVFRGPLFSPSAKKAVAVSGPALSLAILPFRNASGDPSLDWLGPSVADMLSTDVGQSAQLRTVSPTSLHQIFTDLRISSGTVLDPAMIRRVADFSSADRVVWGQYAKFGDQIRIDATLQDIKNGSAVPLKIDVASEKEIPGAIDRLAESIRQKLALPENVLKELKASSFQPSSHSVAALREYNQGINSQRDGKNLEAQKQFEAATKEDPAFALAYSKLAQASSSLGYDSEAERFAKKAVGLSQDLPEAEKYLISAIELQVTKNYPEAIKAYENLARVSPDNSDVRSTLASLYQDSGDLGKARDYYQKILSSNPKDVAATLDLGRIQIKSGDPQSSFDPLNRAYSLAVQVDNEEQKATSLHLMAVAYRMLSKPEEVLRNEHEAIPVWRRIGQKRGLAFSLNEIAKAQVSLGNAKEAVANFQEALQIRRDIGDKRGLGDTLIDVGNFSDDRGDHDQALKMYKEALGLEREIGNESLQAVCLNNIGAVYFEKSEYEDARTYYQQALQIQGKSHAPQDIVDGVHNLAETSVRMGQYDEAVKEYMRALDLRRSMNDARGAAMESYSLGALFEYQGRFGAALTSKQDALKTFRDLKDRTFWMAEILGGYGEALTLAGRGHEAQPYLDEALNLSRELKNDGMVAQTLDFQGDVFFYRGDSRTAQPYYERASQTASHTSEREKVLIAKIDVAMAQVEQKHGRAAMGSLRSLLAQAESLGLKQMAVECSIYLAEAMMQDRDYAHAREELERALEQTDKLGLKPLNARAHYVLGTVLRASGNQVDAQPHFRNAVELLDAMRKEPGGDQILQRADFKVINDEAGR